MKPKAISARLERKSARPCLICRTEVRKEREIRLAKLPPGQLETAAAHLKQLPNLEVIAVTGRLALKVSYNLLEHTLEGLENGLRSAGFHLSNSLYTKVTRALAYYCEETQLHNLESPQRLIKKSDEAYVQAWAQHPHGDHDDTPQELRHDK